MTRAAYVKNGELSPEEKEVAALGDAMLEIRWKALQCPIYMGAHILGHDYLEDPMPEHVEAAEAMKNDEDVLLLLPRGHIKTTLMDIVGTVWDTARDPYCRILITHGTESNAERIFNEATGHLRKNSKFHMFFPEFAKSDGMGLLRDGTTLAYIHPLRKRDLKEPSIMFGSPGATKTGMHYDIIKCSDLVNEQNTPPPLGLGTADSAAQVHAFFGTLIPLLDLTNPRARHHIDGTNWFDGDLYCDIIEKQERHKDDPDYRKFRIIRSGIQMDEEGKPISIWRHMPREALLRAYNAPGMNPYLWAANYVNDPLPLDRATSFRREWFKEYTESPQEIIKANEGMNIAITVDLAISESQRSRDTSRTAMVCTGIAPDGNMYVLDAKAGFWSPPQVIEQLLAMDALWGPRYIGIEAVAYQKAMVYWTQMEAARRGRVPPIRPLYPDGQDKARRAFVLASFAGRYGIHVRPEHSELVIEHVKFGMPGTKNDYVDAMSYRSQDLVNPVGLRAQLLGDVVSAQDQGMLGSELIAMAEKHFGRRRRTGTGRTLHLVNGKAV